MLRLHPAVLELSYGINKSLTTFISLNSKSSIKGKIKIDSLKGVGHLKLHSFKKALMYGKQVDVKGKIAVKKGKLRMYTRINENFWSYASLFVKSKLREENPSKKVVESYHLDGYTFAEVDADNPQSFKGKFLTIGSDLYLLLESVSDEVSGIEIMLD